MAGSAIGDVEVLDDVGYSDHPRRLDANVAFSNAEYAQARVNPPEYGAVASVRHQPACTHVLTIGEG
jgi:hypothetical protein